MNSKAAIQVSYRSTEELLNWGRAQFTGGSVSILAGHYLLIYSHLRSALVPLMRSEFSDGEAEKPYLALSRNFPETTFDCGLNLLLSLGRDRGRILLLVDDETIRFIQGLPEGVRLSDLRRDYFHRYPLAPSVYCQELERRKLSAEQIFEPNFVRRASSTLPSRTYLFSEHVLRSHFRRKTRKHLSSLSGLRLREEPLTTSVILEGSSYINSSCVIEGNGDQTCSGTALALMDVLRARLYEHLVWFLPAGCKDGVTRAVELAVRELEWFKSALLLYENVVPGEASVQIREGIFIGGSPS